MCAPRLRNKLSEEDGEINLGLSEVRHGIPRIERLHGREALKTDIRRKHSREVEAGRLDDVSRRGEHGNASVFQLSSPEPGKGALRSESSKAQRVVRLEGHGGTGHVLEGREGSSPVDLREFRGEVRFGQRGTTIAVVFVGTNLTFFAGAKALAMPTHAEIKAAVFIFVLLESL